MVKHFRCKHATCKCQELHAPAKNKKYAASMRTYFLLIRTLIGTDLLFAAFCKGDYATVLCFGVFAIQ